MLAIDEKDLVKVSNYIDNYWPKLIRANKKDLRSLIGLPNPYIVPANENVFQEQYYWDSYPIVRALIDHPKYSKTVCGMVENFLYLIRRFGIVPNASRLYFLSRSQPPLLSSMVWLVYEKTQDLAWFKKAIKYVNYEYNNVWMGKMPLHNFRKVHKGLSRYYDLNAIDVLAEAESGWDMTARFMGKCLDFLPVDLNCMLYQYEIDLAKAYELFGNIQKEKYYRQQASKRAKTINDLMWDEKTGFYFDYNFAKKRQSKLITIAGIYPLAIGIASEKQAKSIAALVEKILQKDYGLVQSVRFSENSQWDWPNGWAPLQLKSIDGLLKYGYKRLAKRIILKWLSVNIKIFTETGFLWEKYDVVHGRIGVPDRYPTQPGFAWTNAVFIIFVKMLEDLESDPIS